MDRGKCARAHRSRRSPRQGAHIPCLRCCLGRDQAHRDGPCSLHVRPVRPPVRRWQTFGDKWDPGELGQRDPHARRPRPACPDRRAPRQSVALQGCISPRWGRGDRSFFSGSSPGSSDRRDAAGDAGAMTSLPQEYRELSR